MTRPRRGLRTVFGTARGLRTFATNALVAFGLASTSVQLVGQLLPDVTVDPAWFFGGTAVSCVVWGLVRAYPRTHVRRELRRPEVAITVSVGDLIGLDTDIAVGFSDTFDTSTDDDLPINRDSLQGQLLARGYGGDAAALDAALGTALADVGPIARETRRDRPVGKLERYPLGTVAVLRNGGRRVYAVAYSRMDNACVARSSVTGIWLSLDSLWEAVDRHGQRGPLAIPVMGPVLARVDTLPPESLLKMTLLSFVARSRQSVVCHELRVVIRPDDAERIDFLEVAAFLRGL
ncbi:hypothetical protein Val02_52010 [Virgisporangium aliadipatigenens]|uniref:Thoeris protein ThsA Macro domain-containing protein n=1 Tax=Virgisporangium aliadipatigenens TaxID=741659 RepID=A0A8J3YQU3_9ACTN|nr:macro domain-containing protein [Virgisporangium aliadipatigenens]GIJ48315.1 hypothetical protein Val02_52010 [Virgisporangium aliadipatigenens]